MWPNANFGGTCLAAEVNCPDDGYVVPTLPVSYFDAMYDLVQTEKKTNANWYAGGDNKLVWFQIGASKDPLPKRPKPVPLSL